MKRIETRLLALELRQRPAAAPGGIVIDDPETGRPLPGYEPGPGMQIWFGERQTGQR